MDFVQRLIFKNLDVSEADCASVFKQRNTKSGGPLRSYYSQPLGVHDVWEDGKPSFMKVLFLKIRQPQSPKYDRRFCQWTVNRRPSPIVLNLEFSFHSIAQYINKLFSVLPHKSFIDNILKSRFAKLRKAYLLAEF